MLPPIDLATGLQKSSASYLAYWALYEFPETVIPFQVQRPTFFLFYMLEGAVVFTGVTQARAPCCYATFNLAAKFEASFPAGRNRLLYIVLDSGWLESLIEEFPALRPLFYRFRQGESTHGLLPAYPITQRAQELLAKLTMVQDSSPAEKEGHSCLYILRLLAIYHEQLLRDRKPGNELAYRALHYIHEHYRRSELTQAKIAGQLFTTSKTLVRAFRSEFTLSPTSYLRHLRLRLAHDLLDHHAAALNEIYLLAGYQDPHSFRTAFRRYFGYPPKSLI